MIRSPATEGRPASAAPAVRLRTAALLVRSASSKTSRLLRRGRIARGERCGREMHAARCRHSWDALPCRRRALSADSFPAQRLVHTRCQRTQLRDGAHTRAPDCPPQNRACTRRTRRTAPVPGTPPPGRRLPAPGRTPAPCAPPTERERLREECTGPSTAAPRNAPRQPGDMESHLSLRNSRP